MVTLRPEAHSDPKMSGVVSCALCNIFPLEIFSTPHYPLILYSWSKTWEMSTNQLLQFLATAQGQMDRIILREMQRKFLLGGERDFSDPERLTSDERGQWDWWKRWWMSRWQTEEQMVWEEKNTEEKQTWSILLDHLGIKCEWKKTVTKSI